MSTDFDRGPGDRSSLPGRAFSRRDAFKAMAAVCAGRAVAAASPPAAESEVEEEFRRFLVAVFLLTHREVDSLLSREVTDFVFYSRAKFHGEYGYVYASGHFQNGLDRAVCTYTNDETGARRMIAYADRPCRINTYGDSFTECEQVSDGETFQERLASHIGESVRNFGVGGWSVYQCYLRLRREEARLPASDVIFHIYSGDHYRSLCPLTIQLDWPRRRDPHYGTRPYVTANAARGEFSGHPNPCPTPGALHRLCDPEWIWPAYRNDDYSRLMFVRACARRESPGYERYLPMAEAAARRLGIALATESREALAAAIDRWETADALYSTMRIVELVEQFAREKGRRVLYVLSYADLHLMPVLAGAERFDAPLVEFFRSRKLPLVDMMEEHRADFAKFRCGAEEYTARYYTRREVQARGRSLFDHYNPTGNLFLAGAIQPRLVAQMEPKPPAFALPGPPRAGQLGIMRHQPQSL